MYTNVINLEAVRQDLVNLFNVQGSYWFLCLYHRSNHYYIITDLAV